MIRNTEAAAFAGARRPIDRAYAIDDITHAAITSAWTVAPFKFRNEFV